MIFIVLAVTLPFAFMGMARTSVEYVKPILELLKIEDITTDVENDMNNGINSTEIEALNNY